jgi:pSer/pThr/pTyr-binding forkhead associated (FHA) protein
MKAVLVAKTGLSERAECFLEPGKSYTVGRGREADFVLAHRSVSRVHSRIAEAAPGQWQIADAGSHNGTWVNRRRVASHSLRPGDIVQVGLVTLEFRLDSEAAAPSPPAVLPAPPPRPPLPRLTPAAQCAETSDTLPAPPRRGAVAAPESSGPRVGLLVGATAAALAAAAAISVLVMSPPGRPAAKSAEKKAAQPVAAKPARASSSRRLPSTA